MGLDGGPGNLGDSRFQRKGPRRLCTRDRYASVAAQGEVSQDPEDHLACPVTGATEGRDNARTRSPGLPVHVDGARGAA
jgi:hypothetical protein